MAIKHLFGYVPNQSSFFQLTDSQPYARHKSYTSHIELKSDKESNPNRKNSKILDDLSSIQVKRLRSDKANRFPPPKSNNSDKGPFIPFSFDNFSFEYQSKKSLDINYHPNSENINKKSRDMLSNELKDHKPQFNHVFFHIIYHKKKMSLFYMKNL